MSEKMIACAICGELHNENEVIFVESEKMYVCENCIEDNFTQCADCGEWFKEEKMTIVNNGDLVCEKCLEENYDTCYDCGEYFKKDDLIYVDNFGEWVCDDCLHDNFVYCEDCGEWYRDDSNEIHWLENEEKYVCDYCLDNNYTQCEDCGEWYHNGSDDLRYVENFGWVCDNCFSNGYYEYCEDCGCYFQEEDGEYCEDDDCWYCYHCLENKNKVIDGYHNGKGNNYGFMMYSTNRQKRVLLGPEIEIDNGGFNHDNAKILLDLVNNGKHYAIATKDGSLHDGFEIVSAPASLNYHKNKFGWAEMFKKAIDLGYRAHDTETCGLHVHIDRMFFYNKNISYENRLQAKENTELKFLQVLRNNVGWIKHFSRRKNYSYCEINGDANEFTKDNNFVKSFLKSKKGSGRYLALNFSNNNTIEVRIFRGTLNYNTFIACLQFCTLYANIVKTYNTKNIVKVNKNTFVKLAKKRNYNEFLTYMQDRGMI